MNVRELIERLQRCDPDLPVRIAYREPNTRWAWSPASLCDVVSVGTDNAAKGTRVLVANVDMPSLVLPR